MENHFDDAAIEWLRKVREQAWDEGYRACLQNEFASNVKKINPYRKVSKDARS